MPKFSVIGALSREIERREALRKTEKRYISLNRRCLRVLTDSGFTEYHRGDNPEWGGQRPLHPGRHPKPARWLVLPGLPG